MKKKLTNLGVSPSKSGRLEYILPSFEQVQEMRGRERERERERESEEEIKSVDNCNGVRFGLLKFNNLHYWFSILNLLFLYVLDFLSQPFSLSLSH